MNIPPFIDKLELVFGQLEPKLEFSKDKKFIEDYYEWEFCEHDQTVIEFSMSGILGWRESLEKEYGSQFENFWKFLPVGNQWVGGDYDKCKAIEEIKEYNRLKSYKYEYRVGQFIALLEKAIEMGEEVYWE